MEMKEALIKVLEKMNCKEMIEKYRIDVRCSSGYCNMSYSVPTPTKTNPDSCTYRCIAFNIADGYKGFHSSSNSFEYTKPMYCVTDEEAVEIEYLYHCIRKKAEEVELQHLIELL